MEKYSGEEDVYKELVQDSEDNWLFGLMAFAIVEEQKIEWMWHFEETNKRLPNPDEIKSWYEQQSSSVMVRAKGTAENALENFSADVIDADEKAYRKTIEEGIIVNEIRNVSRFWPQFGINVAGGLASAVIFAALLVLVAFFVLNDTSPTEIGEEMKDKVRLIENDNESRGNQ